MKIESIKAYPLSISLGDKSFGFSQGWYKSRDVTIVVVATDEDIKGYGECFGPSIPVAKTIETYVAPFYVGKDPFDCEIIWGKVYGFVMANTQKGLMLEALSGVDIAVWDIKGKATGLPICKLLGGAYRCEAIPYATGLYRPDSNKPIEYLVEEAKGYRDRGFLGMKLKIGYASQEEDLKIIESIRNAIGYDIKLMVDANCAYNSTQAIRMSREMEKYDIYWFEEPVPSDDYDGCLEVKQNSNIPIASGESECTRYGFREFITRRIVDILQPDICCAGGITETKKIMDMASAWYIDLNPHVWGSNVAIAAGLQFYAAIPPIPIRAVPPAKLFEYDQSPNPLREGTTQDKFEVTNGKIDIPMKPGLGVTLDIDFIKHYSVV